MLEVGTFLVCTLCHSRGVCRHTPMNYFEKEAALEIGFGS